MNFKIMLFFAVSFFFTAFNLFGENRSPNSFDPPTVNFQNVRTQHNVYEDGKKGMRIHLDFVIKNMKGKECRAIAYFSFKNGKRLKNSGGAYRTTDGKVATGKNFTPGYKTSRFSNLTLFIPYSELHLNGTFELKYFVSIYYHDLRIANSNSWESFRLTWRTNTSNGDAVKCKRG